MIIIDILLAAVPLIAMAGIMFGIVKWKRKSRE